MRAALRDPREIIAIPHTARADDIPITGHRPHGGERIEVRTGICTDVIQRHHDDARRPPRAIYTQCTQRAPTAIVERQNGLMARSARIGNRILFEQSLRAEHRHERRRFIARLKAPDSLEQRMHRRETAKTRVEPDRDFTAERTSKRSKRRDMRAAPENRAEIGHV